MLEKTILIHPDKIPKEDFLTLLEISQNKQAVTVNVPPRRINEIVLRRQSITADTVFRLGRYFGTTSEFWLNPQSTFDLENAKEKLGEKLVQEVKLGVA